ARREPFRRRPYRGPMHLPSEARHAGARVSSERAAESLPFPADFAAPEIRSLIGHIPPRRDRAMRRNHVSDCGLVSAVLVVGFLVTAGDASAQITSRASVGTGDIEGNNAAGAEGISADGRFVCFSSNATNLVPGDTNAATDLFIFDRDTGSTVRVSV